MELNRGDGSLGTFLGVQAGLAMRSIAMLGSEEQKQRWLPGMARLETLGRVRADRADARFGLGRAGDVGPPRRRRLGASTARRSGSATAPSPTSSCSGRATPPTARSRASWSRRAPRATTPAASTARARCARSGRPRSTLTDLRVPEANRLPGATASRTPARVLAGTRNTVAWAALGHATAAYDIAVAYCRAADAVRQAAGQLPDRAGAAGHDARRGVLHAAVLPAAGPAA